MHRTSSCAAELTQLVGRVGELRVATAEGIRRFAESPLEGKNEMRAGSLSILALSMMFSFAFAEGVEKLAELIKAGYEVKVGVIGPGGTIIVQKDTSAYICIVSTREMTKKDIAEIGNIECTPIAE